MKKQLQFIITKPSLWKIMIVFLLGTVPFFANAQTRLIDDVFNYTSGDLVGQGDWVQTGATSTPSLQVVDVQLTYPGYQDNATGKSIELKNSGQDASKAFTEQNSGEIFAAILVNFSAVQSSNSQGDYFFHFGESTASSLSGGRVMVKKSSGEDKMQFGITRSGTSTITVWDETEYELNKTHLIVLKYKIVEGAKNDITYLFVNPVISATEPEPNATSASTETGIEPSYISAIGIRQGATTRTPLGNVGVLRVALSWAGLFDSEIPEPVTPTLTLSPASSIIFGGVYSGETYTETVNVKGQNLGGDITVSLGASPTGEMALSATTITKAEAESENGYNLTVTLNPADEDNYTDAILFDTPGLAQKKITAYWSTTLVTSVSNLKALRDAHDINDQSKVFRVTGEVFVSHVYKDGSRKYLYIQDATAGITIDDGFGDITTEYKTGDKLVNVAGQVNKTFGTFFLLPVSDCGVPVSEGNEITPVVVTLSELGANPADYEAKLIKVENVEFYDKANENGGVFTEGYSNKIRQGTTEASMRVFKLADFIGDEIPGMANITGISTSGSGNLVAPRSKDDIQAVTVGLTEEAQSDIKVWAENSSILVSGKEISSIEVYNLTGVKLQLKKAEKDLTVINSGSGVYLVKVTANNATEIRKVIVK